MDHLNNLKIFTWHVHGAYLYYISQIGIKIFVPVKKDLSEGYGGVRQGNYNWGDNIQEVDADKVRDLKFDCILFQSEKNYLVDQYEILTIEQRRLPKIYLEHNPPRVSPTDTIHMVVNVDLIVHVTHFNNIMWDSLVPTTVVEHGVDDLGNKYTGEKDKGLVVVNNISTRGRRLGLDVLEKVGEAIPLDIVGTNSEEIGGLGEIPHKNLHDFMAEYRFFFNPIRYTSLGLSVCEAMMIGMPIVSLATTEMPSVIQDGVNGFVSNDLSFLEENMQILIENPEYAKALGENSRKVALKRFNIERFGDAWKSTFEKVINPEFQKHSKEFKRTESFI